MERLLSRRFEIGGVGQLEEMGNRKNSREQCGETRRGENRA
jgi:hypothetical protein